jgi:hypothetical protein
MESTKSFHQQFRVKLLVRLLSPVLATGSSIHEGHTVVKKGQRTERFTTCGASNKRASVGYGVPFFKNYGSEVNLGGAIAKVRITTGQKEAFSGTYLIGTLCCYHIT